MRVKTLNVSRCSKHCSNLSSVEGKCNFFILADKKVKDKDINKRRHSVSPSFNASIYVLSSSSSSTLRLIAKALNIPSKNRTEPQKITAFGFLWDVQESCDAGSRRDAGAVRVPPHRCEWEVWSGRSFCETIGVVAAGRKVSAFKSQTGKCQRRSSWCCWWGFPPPPLIKLLAVCSTFSRKSCEGK